MPCRSKSDQPAALLAQAAKLAQNIVHIPQALLHYRRELQAEDVFAPDGKRVLVMSHVLDMTGAPVVLVSAVPVLRSLGYQVVVLGPAAEGSHTLFLENGATVITNPDCVAGDVRCGVWRAGRIWCWPIQWWKPRQWKR